MKTFITVLALLIASCTSFQPAYAEWKDKNTQINQTNFILMEYHQPICSATLISLKYKLILTAHHCIDSFIDIRDGEEIQDDGTVKKVKREVLTDVTLGQKAYQGFRLVGDSNYQAVIVAHKQKMDMALLQLRADTIPQTVYSHIAPETKAPQRGDRVWVVGNPLGLLDATLTTGVISSTTRMYATPWAENADVPFLQTDASINGGNSGGSMYNDDGELIGIPDAGWRGANGLGLTLTPESIREFLKDACYEDVYKADGQGHNECVKAKEAAK